MRHENVSITVYKVMFALSALFAPFYIRPNSCVKEMRPKKKSHPVLNSPTDDEGENKTSKYFPVYSLMHESSKISNVIRSDVSKIRIR